MLPLPLLLSLLLVSLPSAHAIGHSPHHAGNDPAHLLLSSNQRSANPPPLVLRSSDPASDTEDEALCPTPLEHAGSGGAGVGGSAPFQNRTVAAHGEPAAGAEEKRGLESKLVTSVLSNPKFKPAVVVASSAGTSAASKSTSAKSSSKSTKTSVKSASSVVSNPKSVSTSKSPAALSSIVVLAPTSTKRTKTTSISLASATPTSQVPVSSTSTKKAVAKSSSAVLSLPTPPASNCATQYTTLTSGAVYGPGLGSFAMSPRPSKFVKRSGAGLTLDGEAFRMVGPNIYWLGLDENVIPDPSYPSQGRVREAMAISVAMGANTVRSHTLGISTGNSLSLWPSNGNTNTAAFDAIDYAIFAARNYGLRLVIPLTDNYAYYHGGKFDFIGWAGLSTSDERNFYAASTTTIFKAYISVLLNHVNTYTGVALKGDPTILAWETGNELGGYMLNGGAPPASWTKSIATYINTLAPNHLVIDGADGLIDTNGDVEATGFGVSAVDMVTDHFYPALDWLLTKDEGILASETTKNYFVGELDWTGLNGGDTLTNFYSILEGMSGSGSMIWSVFGHDATCCNYVTHNDGYSALYPNGNTAALQAQLLLVTQHWNRMRGLTPPTSLPAVACPQPALLA